MDKVYVVTYITGVYDPSYIYGVYGSKETAERVCKRLEEGDDYIASYEEVDYES